MPSPAIIEFGNLPSGITFTDNGDGTATLSGTSTGPVGSYPLIFTVDNGISPERTQNFTLTLTSTFPPSHLKGFRKTNRFLLQTEYDNLLTWDDPRQGNPVSSYRIYRDVNLQQVIGEVSGHGPFSFKDHSLQRNRSYTYYIVSVDTYGNTSTPAEVTI